MKNLITTLLLSTCAFFQGNAQSIQQVKAFNPNDTAFYPYNQYTDYNGKLFIASWKQLWVSDGTASGTHILKSFLSKDYIYTIYGLTTLNNKLLFMAYDEISGWELWTSDGTMDGTKVIDINPGPADGIYNPFLNKFQGFYDAPLAKMNGNIYYYGNDGINGVELWTSDGTLSGTHIIKDINTIPFDGITNSTYIREMAVTNNKLFFRAFDTTHGHEMWVSDGTPQGTNLIKEILPGTGGTLHGITLSFQDKVIFNIGNGLYITDGTSTNTFMLNNYMKIESREIIELNNKVYFYASGPFSLGSLMETDGTISGTKEVVRVLGNMNIYNYRKINLTLFNGHIYFTQYHPDSTSKNGIWESDGTPGNTSLFFSTLESPYNITEFNDKLYFRMHDRANKSVDIWESDGTLPGTKKVSHYFTNASVNYSLLEHTLANGNYTSWGSHLYFVYSFSQPDVQGGLYRIGMWPDNITKTQDNSNINIYPNPAQTELIISAPNMTGISVSNIVGVAVYMQKDTENTIRINTRDWAPGSYIAAIQTNDGQTAHRKIIKE